MLTSWIARGLNCLLPIFQVRCNDWSDSRPAARTTPQEVYEKRLNPENNRGGSVAEWLACWTQAQKGPGSYRSRDAVG